MSYVRLSGHVIEVNPLAVLALNNTLCAKNHTEGIVLGEKLERVLNSLYCKLFSGLAAEAGEHLISVMMVVSVVMASTVAMLIVIVMMVIVVMLVLVVMASAFAMLIVIVMMVIVVMLVLVVMTSAFAMLIVIMVMVTVVMLVLVVMTSAVAMLIVIVVMMTVVMLVVLMLLLKFLERCGEGILLLHCCEDILAVELVPRGCYDSCLGVMLSDKLNGLLCLMRLCNVCVRENDAGCVSDLIVVEFTEVLHIHLALVHVGDGGEAIKDSVLSLNGLYSLDNVGQLSYSAGLDDNSVGVEFVKHLSERLRKITDERAADTSGIHLGDLNARILKKAAVDTDLTELVFDEYKLFACVGFLNKFFDKCSLAGSEEAGENIYFRHIQIIARGQTSVNTYYILIIHF